MGVTRHQLLVHPSVPYTSHNSALCLALETGAPLEKIADACVDGLDGQWAPGSDPGLCVASVESVPGAVVDFGRSAQRSVVEHADAESIALAAGVWLRSLAGSRCGVIGALAAVGLRASGNDGRFVGLAGIRDIDGVVRAGELLERSAISRVVEANGEAIGDHELIDSGGWIRPSVIDHHPVLVVGPASDGGLRTPAVTKGNRARRG